MASHRLPALAAVILLLCLALASSAQAQTYNWRLSPDVAWRLPATGAVIRFGDYYYADSVTWDSFNASTITFTRLQISNDNPVQTFGIGVKGANATIYYLNRNNDALIRLSAPTGVGSTLTIIYPDNPPDRVEVLRHGISEVFSQTQWLQDRQSFQAHQGTAVLHYSQNKTLLVKAIHMSDVDVYLHWVPAASPPPGGGVVIYSPAVTATSTAATPTAIRPPGWPQPPPPDPIRAFYEAVMSLLSKAGELILNIFKTKPAQPSAQPQKPVGIPPEALIIAAAAVFFFMMAVYLIFSSTGSAPRRRRTRRC